MKISGLLPFLMLALCVAVRGQTPVSFGQALSGTVTLPNGVFMSAYIITGQNGTPGSGHGDTFINSPSMGGTFDGTVFDGTVNPYYATRLEGNPSQSVDDGIDQQRRDFVGIRVHFSQATEISSFYFVDIHGGSDNSNAEWAASFGYNGNTLLVPTLTVPSTGSDNVAINTPAINGSWNTLVDNTLGTSVNNLPGTWTLGQQLFSGTNGDRDPDQPSSQMKVTYTSKVTDLFVLWGLRDDRSGLGASSQNSGVTGFTVTVPEPSAALHFLAAGGFFLLRGRRRGK